MVLSITSPGSSELDEQMPKNSPPWVWLGFVFAFAFLCLEFLEVILGLESQQVNGGLTIIAFGGGIYWLICVHRIHKILVELTRGRYKISAAEAVGMHFIPFYNLYWLFKWPNEMSQYLNGRGRIRMISGSILGLLLLFASLLRFVDGAVGLFLLFGITVYISGKLNSHVRALREGSAENLPPLPDPRMFEPQRPILSHGTQAVADQSRVD